MAGSSFITIELLLTTYQYVPFYTIAISPSLVTVLPQSNFGKTLNDRNKRPP